MNIRASEMCKMFRILTGIGCILAFLLFFLVVFLGVWGRSTRVTPDSPKEEKELGLDPVKVAPTLPPSKPMPDFSTIRFVSIPGGNARVGSEKSEPGRDSSMESSRTISVAEMEMSKTEVTVGQFYAIMDPTRSISLSEANQPITNITWHEALQFCQLLTIKTGKVHRLPMEAEWEHACKAGSDEMISTWMGNCELREAITSFHRGDTGKLIRGLRKSCNVDTGKVLEVGLFAENRFGLQDMHGNCWEWIALEGALSTPPTPMHAPIRGASGFSTNPLEVRSANRAWQMMSQASAAIGLRVVREITN